MHRYRFGLYELRPASGDVLRGGHKLELSTKQFQILLALAEAAEQSMPVATPEWIVRRVWYEKDWPSGRNSLKVHISHLKDRLDEGTILSARGADGVRGYRLSGAVAASLPGAEADAPPNLYAIGAEQLTWLAMSPAEGAEALDRWHVRARSFAEAIARHGGLQRRESAHVLTACFPGPAAAVACSRRLHQVAHTDAESGSFVRVLLLPDAAVSAGGVTRRQVATREVAGVPPGATWAASRLALIDTLDGAVVSIPAQTAPQQAGQDDFVRLVDPLMDPHDEPPILRKPRLEPMVAVIPFSAEQAEGAHVLPLGNILTHVLTSALHSSRIIRVIAFQSAFQFAQRNASVRQIARALDADYVVTGQYRRQGRRLSVTLQVADGHTEELLAGRSASGLQSEVRNEASALVTTLADCVVSDIVNAELPRPRQAPMPDLPSHTLLLAGIHLMYRLSPADHAMSQQALQTLHERVVRHAAPPAWLALWHVFQLAQGWSSDPRHDAEQAESYARRALDIDPESALALTMMGSVCNLRPDRRDEALAHFDEALARNANEPMAWLQKGNALAFAGRGIEGLECVETALRLSPLDPARHYYLALMAGAALSAGQWDRAASGAQRSLVLNPRHVPSHRVLAIALMMGGRIEEGKAAVARLRQLQPALTASLYVANSPGKPELARQFGQALREGGLPP
jgi:TolB-like protein/DNA-binding winged helix-turn-helix (wHTH) protein/Tfp pilus assembly protein PilF